MKRTIAAVLIAAGAAVACEGVPLAPRWNVDVLFPLQFPDVMLEQQVTGGILPPTDVSFTAPVDSQEVSDLLGELREQEIDTLRAAFVLVNQAQITGTLELSFATTRAQLFAASGPGVVTVSMPIRVTAGDTTRVTVNPGFLQAANRIYFQSRGTMRSSTGGLQVMGPNDRFALGVNLTANVPFSR